MLADLAAKVADTAEQKKNLDAAIRDAIEEAVIVVDALAMAKDYAAKDDYEGVEAELKLAQNGAHSVHGQLAAIRSED